MGASGQAATLGVCETTMKILFLSAVGKKDDPQTKQTYDLDASAGRITDGLRLKLAPDEIVHIHNVIDASGVAPVDALRAFDLVFCDVTTGNPNILYIAGLMQGMGAPMVVFAARTAALPVSLQPLYSAFYAPEAIDDDLIEALASAGRSALQRQGIGELTKPPSLPKSAFISYSHKDESYLQRLLVHLMPLSRQSRLDLWVDKRIKVGDKWRDEIQTALARSSIAILLISADFMASDFIVENELAPLLTAAEHRGTRILPLIVSPSRFLRDKRLSVFQAANDPALPLSALTPEQRENVFESIAATVESHLPDA